MTDEAWQDAPRLEPQRHVLRHSAGAAVHGSRSGWGRIINISSVEGKHGNKAMVTPLHHQQARHQRADAVRWPSSTAPTGITCNAICPGAIETDIMKTAGPRPPRRWERPTRHFLEGYARGVVDQTTQHRRGGRRHGCAAGLERGRRDQRCRPRRARWHIAGVRVQGTTENAALRSAGPRYKTVIDRLSNSH